MPLSNDNRCMEAVSLADVAKEFGTPTYCYSQARIATNFDAYKKAFAQLPDALVCFAVKANSNSEILKILAVRGAGADVVSGGELALALEAGILPEKIVFSGVAKTPGEIRFALEQNILQINVESEPELLEINRIAAEMGICAEVALRINPDIAVDTNEKIATGNAETKFGIPWKTVTRLLQQPEKLQHTKVKGIAVHLGSQIQELAPYAAAFDRLAVLVAEAKEMGAALETLDIGGGLGINYSGDSQDLPTPGDLCALVQAKLAFMGCKVIVEPGRSLVGDAGILLSSVIYEKTGEDRDFLIIDAGMNDFLRPSMYGAFHRIVPLCIAQEATPMIYDIVGPVCETGDTFAKQRQMPKMKSGDLVAIMDTGAYGAVMASTYNARPLAAEVLIDGDSCRRIDQHQTVRDRRFG